MATVAGGTLGICGAALQAHFRNPLASTFTLGISGGASLGALIGIRLGLAAGILGFSMVSILAFIFSLLTMLFFRSQSGSGRRRTPPARRVVMNFLYSAFVLFIQFFSNSPSPFRLCGGLWEPRYSKFDEV
jgi:iron complex transport system permease protein